MKKILYIGNQLSRHGFNKTTIETLSQLLSTKFDVTMKSSKSNKLLRLIDMISGVFRSKDSIILIDTYSTNAFYFAFFSSMASKLLGKKYILILHGGNLPWRFDTSPWKSRLMLAGAYHVVAPSVYLARSVEEKFALKVDIIPNSIELSRYEFSERQDYSSLNILWVRAFDEIYDPLLAIDILYELIGRGYDNAHLCMIGPDKDGSLRRAKKYASELVLKDKIEFTGYLTKDIWLRKAREFNMFINTSKFDNMPVSLIEVMALGLPIVTTDVGGISFFVNNGEEVLFSKPGSVTQFADSIEYLINDDMVRNKLIVNARQKALRFDDKTILNEWENILIC